MREVTVARTLSASPPAVQRRLTPRRVVEYEGSFTVTDVHEEGEDTVVVATGGGLEVAFRFEPRDRGLYYTQESGPFAAMETWASAEQGATDRETRVTLRSAVSLGLPAAPVTDRVAAWKRRRELERALDALASDL